MLDGFEALRALAEQKTTSRAAVELGITQSAVSKRIANLEASLKRKLTERAGRYVVLTPYAETLLAQAGPLLAELQYIAQAELPVAQGIFPVAVTRAIASSWGAEVLARTERRLHDISLKIVIDGGPGTVENVRSGYCLVGILRGTGESAPDLHAEHLGDEDMVFLPSGLKAFRFPRRGTIPILGLAPAAEAQQIMERRLARLVKSRKLKFEVTGYCQSWTVVTQMARAGFGHAVVPRVMTRVLGIPQRKLKSLPKPGLSLPVSLVCRRSARARPLVESFVSALKESLSLRTGGIL